MYFINPFKAIRPTKENASSVPIASTDHLSKEMQIDHLKNNQELERKQREEWDIYWRSFVDGRTERVFYFNYLTGV